MAKPSHFSNKTSTLQNLMAEMPYHVSRDPLSLPIFSVQIFNSSATTDVVTLEIIDGIMFVRSNTSYISTEEIELYDFTMDQLLQYFSNKYFIQGISFSYVVDSSETSKTLLASALLEGIYIITPNKSAELDYFTSSNYALLQSFALVLSQQKNNMLSSLKQIDIKTANGKWLDFWGRLVGLERFGEESLSDLQYRYRLENETTGVKVNNIGMADMLSRTLNRHVTIVDGGKPFLLSGTYGKATGIAQSHGKDLGQSLYLTVTSKNPFQIGQNIVVNPSLKFVGLTPTTQQTVSVSGTTAIISSAQSSSSSKRYTFNYTALPKSSQSRLQFVDAIDILPGYVTQGIPQTYKTTTINVQTLPNVFQYQVVPSTKQTRMQFLDLWDVPPGYKVSALVTQNNVFSINGFILWNYAGAYPGLAWFLCTNPGAFSIGDRVKITGSLPANYTTKTGLTRDELLAEFTGIKTVLSIADNWFVFATSPKFTSSTTVEDFTQMGSLYSSAGFNNPFTAVPLKTEDYTVTVYFTQQLSIPFIQHQYISVTNCKNSAYNGTWKVEKCTTTSVSWNTNLHPGAWRGGGVISAVVATTTINSQSTQTTSTPQVIDITYGGAIKIDISNAQNSPGVSEHAFSPGQYIQNENAYEFGTFDTISSVQYPLLNTTLNTNFFTKSLFSMYGINPKKSFSITNVPESGGSTSGLYAVTPPIQMTTDAVNVEAYFPSKGDTTPVGNSATSSIVGCISTSGFVANISLITNGFSHSGILTVTQMSSSQPALRIGSYVYDFNFSKPDLSFGSSLILKITGMSNETSGYLGTYYVDIIQNANNFTNYSHNNVSFKSSVLYVQSVSGPDLYTGQRFWLGSESGPLASNSSSRTYWTIIGGSAMPNQIDERSVRNTKDRQFWRKVYDVCFTGPTFSSSSYGAHFAGSLYITNGSGTISGAKFYSGQISPQSPLFGPTIPSGLTIVNDISPYAVSGLSARITGTISDGMLNAATVTGVLCVGQTLSGDHIPEGTVITGDISGNGSIGVYAINTTINVLVEQTINASFNLPSQNVSTMYSCVTFTGESISDPLSRVFPVEAATIGPDAATGSFDVLVGLEPNESILSNSLISTMVQLVNKWKPAGVPYTIRQQVQQNVGIVSGFKSAGIYNTSGLSKVISSSANTLDVGSNSTSILNTDTSLLTTTTSDTGQSTTSSQGGSVSSGQSQTLVRIRSV